jgi:hypothetical protein
MKSLTLLGLAATLALVACSDAPVAVDDASTLGASTPAGATTAPGGTGPAGTTSSTPARVITTDEDFDCVGTVTGTFQNVFVPAGQSCTLTNARVRGNILARENARLFVFETVTAGNIDGVEARQLHVRGGRLEGSIQAQDGASAGEVGIRISGGTVLTQGNITIQKMRTGTIEITGARLLKGNIQVQENTVGTALTLTGNEVAQNVEVFVNSGVGAKTVRNNTVQQKLSCKENTRPFTGRPNVAGDVEGQCGR